MLILIIIVKQIKNKFNLYHESRQVRNEFKRHKNLLLFSSPKCKAMNNQNLPTDMMQKDIIVPTTPNRSIVEKLRKNCFFLTWKLENV